MFKALREFMLKLIVNPIKKLFTKVASATDTAIDKTVNVYKEACPVEKTVYVASAVVIALAIIATVPTWVSATVTVGGVALVARYCYKNDANLFYVAPKQKRARR